MTRRSTPTAWRPRWSTPTPTRSRAARACRSAPASACGATSIPSWAWPARRPTTGGSPSCARCSPERRCGVALVPITAELDDVLGEIRRAKEDGLGAVMIPAMWVQPGAVPRPQVRPGVGAVRRAPDAGGDALGLRVARRVRRPPRHLRHRGHVVAGAPAVVPAVVGRVRALPRSALRRHRGRVLVAARPAVVVGPAVHGPEGRREAGQGRVRRPGRRCSRASTSTATASPASPT